LAKGIAELGLGHVVITSVTRDDLPDGGSIGYEMALKAIRELPNAPSVEVLVPDMGGVKDNIARVIGSAPQVFAHNIEVVPRLQAVARDPMTSFERSIDVLRTAKELSPAQITKTSLMLGLGETGDEVMGTLQALKAADVDMVTMGQYLRPNSAKMPVARYVTPEEFKAWRTEALALGFGTVMAGPFVRSSYLAKEAYDSLRGGSKC
jgi:lipoic acid synthetase